MPACVQYPAVGCLVEFFDASAAQVALVLEESGGKLRLFLPSRRETKLPATRVLPWIAPPLPGFAAMSRDEMVKALERAKRVREEKARALSVTELWELAQGEVQSAPAQWFAELLEEDPDADSVAACARALLACRTRFRFAPPVFEVYDAEKVARKEEESRRQREREELVSAGAPFFRLLWNVHLKKIPLPDPGSPAWPAAETADRLEAVLRARMEDPDGQDPLWPMLSRGLPDDGFLPVELLEAWGRVPAHYNFWYDRAAYARGDAWWRKKEETVQELAAAAGAADLPLSGLPFVSIDGESTRDIDDAFFLEEREWGLTLHLALAAPALAWPFGSAFDQQILHRGTSVYLPEGDSHMLPEFLGTDVYSLVEGCDRPALVISQDLTPDGSLSGECRMALCRVRLAANLRYADCQAVLDGSPAPGSRAAAYADLLRLARDFSEKRMARRIEGGAVILDKDEPSISLEGEGEETRVILTPGDPASDAQNMVAEMMILASGAAAEWARARKLPVLFRTQNVALPRESAGRWRDPLRMSEIMRAMIPSILETEARPHAALGLSSYAPVTSPLRRYADLVNEAQILSVLRGGEPTFSAEALERLLVPLRVALDAVGQIQRFRPRYWKLLFFRQAGEKRWWPGTVTERTDLHVSVSLPEYDFFVRGRPRVFEDRASPGTRVRVRFGRINPLCNEITVLEAVMEDDCAPEVSGALPPEWEN